MSTPEAWVTAVAETIHAERSARRLTQDQLGEAVGRDRVTIARFERGIRQPNVELMAKIAAVLGMGLAEFLALAERRLPADD